MADLTSELIDGLVADSTDYRPGTRPIHTVGIGAVGRFRGSSVASSYTKARHFVRSWTPVTIRFSNGSGATVPDGEKQVRGMAVKFHLPEETDESGVHHAAVDTDLLTMSVPVFIAKTPEDSIEFSKAYEPKPMPTISRRERLKALLALSPLPAMPPPGTITGDPGVVAFAQHYAPGRALAIAYSMLSPPVSYLRTAFFAVHAFDLEDAQGNHRWVRFVFEPAEGVRDEFRTNLPYDYLRHDLGTRLAARPGRFVLRMQIADPWDDPSDPTTVWLSNRRRISMGTLMVDRLVDDQVADCEKLSFNPGRLVPGIGLSADPILQARVAVYNESQARRDATQCPVHTAGATPASS